MTRLLWLGLGAFIGAASVFVFLTAAAREREPVARWMEGDDGIQPGESIAQIVGRYLQ